VKVKIQLTLPKNRCNEGVYGRGSEAPWSAEGERLGRTLRWFIHGGKEKNPSSAKNKKFVVQSVVSQFTNYRTNALTDCIVQVKPTCFVVCSLRLFLHRPFRPAVCGAEACPSTWSPGSWQYWRYESEFQKEQQCGKILSSFLGTDAQNDRNWRPVQLNVGHWHTSHHKRCLY
jgi:hypothetical protein